VALAVAILGLLPAEAFAQSTADELAEARDRLADLQRDADSLAEEYAQVYARSATIEQQIVEIDARVERLTADQRAQRGAAGARAVQLYVQSSNSALTPLLLESGTAMDAARRDLYSTVIANRDRRTLDELRAVGQDLRALRDALDKARIDASNLARRLEDEAVALDTKLIEAQRIRDQLGDQLIAEEEAARREAAAALARAEAEAQVRADAQRDQRVAGDADEPDAENAPAPDDDDQGGAGGGSYGVDLCPIRGAVAFSDTWGDARPGGRSHQGVDLLSPAGTPNVAVTSGRIEQDHGDRMGNAIFLYGDNGNTYYYFHLSAFEGGQRDVAQGELIGYVGSTGASGANHTHFEIHPGGGGAVNPYAAARAVC